MMNNGTFQIRAMTLADLELVLEWAAQEGWNPGLYDASAFYSADPPGFLMGEVDGEPISSISAVKYNDTFVFMGVYIVKPGWRGQGFGLQTWKAALQLIGDRPAALDGVLQQVDNYQKFGFQPAYSHVRYQGTGASSNLAEGIVPLSTVPFAEVENYDRRHFPAPRTAFLQKWINPPAGVAYGAIKDGKLSGYGVIRAARQGFKIAPLFADDAQIAEDLFQALSNYAAGETIFLDIPNINLQAVALVERHEMSPVFECVRMYTHEPPKLNHARIFGVTSLELG